MHDSATHTPPPPEIQCEVVELLGSGTTGTVWRATLSAPLGEVPAGTDIAIKRLHAKAALTPELSAAFGRECEAALAVRSPGIVRGLAAGQDSTGSWLALRYVPGLTLRQQLDAHGALPEPQVRMVAERLVRALSDLHAAGYLHGDLKPDNVRFDGEGRAVLLDLGFVIPIPLESGPNRTSGSLPYLSPEELRGLRANGSSEVYSLGILLYEAASGSHPFASKSELSNADELPNALLTNTFEPPSLRVPTLSPFLDSLLEEMLSGQPTQRPGLVNLVEITASQESSSWWRDVQVSAGGAAHKTRRQSASNLPLVGRRQEMEALLAAAARLQPDASLDRDAGGGVLRLVGARGIGKSRLIREFARRVRAGEPAPLYLQGRCSSFQEARPCQPILTLLSRFLGLPGGAQPGEREQTLLATLLPSAERNALLGALDPGYAGATSASIPAALTAWLLALGQTGAVIIYVDDLQYADEGTLEILSRLTAELQRSPLLLILGSDPTEVARRPEAQRVLEERLTALPSSATIELGPLSKDALLDLTDALFSHAAPRRRLASVLWKRSRGNPGMLAELLRGLLKRGEALPTADGLELLIHPDELPLPESLREETARAYAQLDPHDRVWLARLAVSGGRIQTRFLLLAWPRERASDLDLTLARLTRGGWLRPDGDRFHFRRPAQRSAIYKRLPSERRRELHSAVARALLPGPGGKLSLADAFQRAYHLRCAGDFEGLLRILRPLLKRLLDRGQPARVHTLGLWGLEALSNLPKEKRTGSMAMEFLWAAADAADRLGYREKQRQLLEQIESFQKEGESDPQAQARVFLLYARYAISTGQHEKARGMLLQALQLLEPTNATELLCSILLSLASIDTHEGDLGLARRRARQVIERAQDPLILARGELAL
ncbi:MAG: tetratricopeptide (TPR) repeat protein, partial [Candidatus Paceibacteria bacterium]